MPAADQSDPSADNPLLAEIDELGELQPDHALLTAPYGYLIAGAMCMVGAGLTLPIQYAQVHPGLVIPALLIFASLLTNVFLFGGAFYIVFVASLHQPRNRQLVTAASVVLGWVAIFGFLAWIESIYGPLHLAESTPLLVVEAVVLGASLWLINLSTTIFMLFLRLTYPYLENTIW